MGASITGRFITTACLAAFWAGCGGGTDVGSTGGSGRQVSGKLDLPALGHKQAALVALSADGTRQRAAVGADGSFAINLTPGRTYAIGFIDPSMHLGNHFAQLVHMGGPTGRTPLVHVDDGDDIKLGTVTLLSTQRHRHPEDLDRDDHTHHGDADHHGDDDDDGGMQTCNTGHGGTTPPNGGTGGNNGGTTNPPAGNNGGATNPPAGNNGGTTPPNGGTTPPNGGTTPPNGGTTPPNGGTMPPAGSGQNPTGVPPNTLSLGTSASFLVSADNDMAHAQGCHVDTDNHSHDALNDSDGNDRPDELDDDPHHTGQCGMNAADGDDDADHHEADNDHPSDPDHTDHESTSGSTHEHH